MNAAPPYPIKQEPTRSAITYIRDSVAAYLDGIAVVAKVGLKYRSFTLNQDPLVGANRVVFIPGVFEGDTEVKVRDFGGISRATQNTSSVVNPAEIGMWEKPLTISIWAAQPVGTAGDEGAAQDAAEDLLEQVFRALVSVRDPSTGQSIAASLIFGPIRLQSPPSDNGFGCEILWQVNVLCPLFGPSHEVVQANLDNLTTDKVTFT
jgi:hypothetical protein